MKQKVRLAVVSPFLDKRHGTERPVVEWLSNLPPDFEIQVYSQRVEDLDPSQITWHRIPTLSGPHLFNYLWWFAANQFWRWRDARFKGLSYDLVFTPGVNCLDADVIPVFVVFGEYNQRVWPRLSLTRNPLRSWPSLIHRKLYYRLIAFLERRVYGRLDATLIVISRKTAAELANLFGRSDDLPVIYLGLDHETFNPARRQALRAEARVALALPEKRFVLLLVGNDWRNKGVPVLLDAIARLRELPIDLLVAGSEEPSALRKAIEERGLAGRIHAVPHRKDVEFYYAAADAYVGPSLQDNFALPPAEAMACGLPVIVSAANGTSEIITSGANGLVLQDPNDAESLAAMIRRLYEDREFAQQLGDKAAETAQQYTWQRNGRELAAIFEGILRRKMKVETQPLTQES